MIAPERPTWESVRTVLAERLRILLAAAPRHAPNLWVLVCVLAFGVLALYVSILARGF